jgi:D-glycero-D-manno-heptose 1,7-bisphosphate phosphatase
MSAYSLMSRLIILDRDGVINEDSEDFVKSVDECHLIPGSVDAIVRLCDAGYQVVVATNQSGIARGLFDEFDLAHIHQYISEQVEEAGGRIEAFVYCPHGPDDNCECRKPKPGLLENIAAEFGLPLHGCSFVGDSLRDLQAALAAGCEPVLVLTGKGEKTLMNGLPPELESTRIYKNLATFVESQLNLDDA